MILMILKIIGYWCALSVIGAVIFSQIMEAEKRKGRKWTN